MTAIFQADRLHCPPLDLYDEPTPKRFWRQAASIVRAAELEVKRLNEKQR